nr:hypothetical protein [Tanacetum cinerariifolium]
MSRHTRASYVGTILTMVMIVNHDSRDEDLSTIPKKESDKFIKSSIEDLVPILKDIESTTSYDSNLDESALLVTPILVSNEDECFDLGDDIELLLHRDPSTPKISVASILDEFTNESPLE